MLGKREVKAFALAPLPMVLPVLLMSGAILAGPPQHAADAFVVMFQSLVAIYGATLLIGMPIHLLLRRNRQLGLRSYLVLTVMAVTLIAGAAAIWDRLHRSPVNSNPFALHLWSAYGIKLTFVFALLAALSASIFWSVAVRQQRS